MPVENWQQATQVNSPDSVRQAVLLALAAVLLVVGFFVLRFTMATVADDSGVKTKATPCRRA
jgi:hypothetical protein